MQSCSVGIVWTDVRGRNYFKIDSKGIPDQVRYDALAGVAGDSESRSAVQNDDKSTPPLRETPHPSLPQSGEGAQSHPSAGDSVSSTE